jgi:hypothetical protein
MSPRIPITPSDHRQPKAVASYPVFAGWASFALEEWNEFTQALLAHGQGMATIPHGPLAAMADAAQSRKTWAKVLDTFRALVGDGYLGE